jgi:hypothetical protein
VVELEIDGRREVEAVLYQVTQYMTRRSGLDGEVIPGHAGRLIVWTRGPLADADREGRPVVEEESVEMVVVDRDDQIRFDVLEV